MSEIVVRVKRKREEEPADMILLQENASKRHKSIGKSLGSLSLSPVHIALKLKRPQPSERSFQSFEQDMHSYVKDASIKTRNLSAKAQRLAKAVEFRETLTLEYSSETIYCNGQPLRPLGVSSLDPKEACEVDEYELCEVPEEELYKVSGVFNYQEIVDSEDEYLESCDSEDSNREDHPWNDYPDTESDATHSSGDSDFEY